MVSVETTPNTNMLAEHFRCPEDIWCFDRQGELAPNPGYFRFGQNTIGFGRETLGIASKSADLQLVDLRGATQIKDSKCFLPFDPAEVVDNLRRERYVDASKASSGIRGFGKKAYYLARPVLPVAARAMLKRYVNRGWERKAFPSWPLDRTADLILEHLMILSMEALGLERVPFIWFWPKGYSGCVVMTHDVETSAGLDFCTALMDLNDNYGIKSSFQIVPQERYSVPASLLEDIRTRGFEVNVHDWNHDGRLFSDRDLFLARAAKINAFAARNGAKGFRGGALYRNLEWFDAFTFDYDMSVPNVGHLDPQPGGCCTLMPYFIGRILEIPLTTAQDYMLFHLMGDFSVDLWKRQLETILEHNGLATFLVHPDYIIEPKPRSVYGEMLEHLSEVRVQNNVWIVTPGEVNRWWRNRSQLTLVQKRGEWHIVGAGSEQASLAYATANHGRLEYELAPQPGCALC